MIPDSDKACIFIFNPFPTNLNSCIVPCDEIYFITLILEAGVQAATLP